MTSYSLLNPSIAKVTVRKPSVKVSVPMSLGTGLGNVSGPDGAITGNLPVFDNPSGRHLADSGIPAVEVIRSTGGTMTAPLVLDGNASGAEAISFEEVETLIGAGMLPSINTGNLLGRALPSVGLGPVEEVAPGFGLVLGGSEGAGSHASLPAGGTAGQVLAKISSVDYDAAWVTTVVAFAGSHDGTLDGGFDDGDALQAWMLNCAATGTSGKLLGGIRTASGVPIIIPTGAAGTRTFHIYGNRPSSNYVYLDGPFPDYFLIIDQNQGIVVTRTKLPPGDLRNRRLENFGLFGQLSEGFIAQRGIAFRGPHWGEELDGLQIFNLWGPAIYMGYPAANGDGGCGEMYVERLRIGACGNLTEAALVIGGHGSTFGPNLSMFNTCKVTGNSDSIHLHSLQNANGVHEMYFTDFMQHGTGVPSAAVAIEKPWSCRAVLIEGSCANVEFRGHTITQHAAEMSVAAATVTTLPAYTHSGGVLTATANGAFPAIDGTTLTLADDAYGGPASRVLVKDETDAQYNGVYAFTREYDPVGIAPDFTPLPWQLTRQTFWDAPMDFPKSAVWVDTTVSPLAATNRAKHFRSTWDIYNPTLPVIGTDDLAFEEFDGHFSVELRDNIGERIHDPVRFRAPVIINRPGTEDDTPPYVLADVVAGFVIDATLPENEVTVADGDRFLWAPFESAIDSGVYIAHTASPPTRAADLSAGWHFPNASVAVEEGEHIDSVWRCVSPVEVPVLGTSRIGFMSMNAERYTRKFVFDGSIQASANGVLIEGGSNIRIVLNGGADGISHKTVEIKDAVDGPVVLQIPFRDNPRIKCAAAAARHVTIVNSALDDNLPWSWYEAREQSAVEEIENLPSVQVLTGFQFLPVALKKHKWVFRASFEMDATAGFKYSIVNSGVAHSAIAIQQYQRAPGATALTALTAVTSFGATAQSITGTSGIGEIVVEGSFTAGAGTQDTIDFRFSQAVQTVGSPARLLSGRIVEFKVLEV